MALTLNIALVFTVTAATCIVLLFGLLRFWFEKRSSSKVRLPRKEIAVVESEPQWTDLYSRLLFFATRDRVLGFDCEWVNQKGYTSPVALMQLATTEGLCVILRMNKMDVSTISGGHGINSWQKEFKELLENREIVKVGVAPHVDSKKLMEDYGLFVQSYLDLGWLATYILGNQLPGYGLKSLAKLVLDIELDKSWQLRCSDWEADVLTEQQIEYAAEDALVSVEIFLTLVRRCNVESRWIPLVKAWLDRPYHHKNHQNSPKRKNNSVNERLTKKAPNYCHMVRKRPLYHNCILQAPDGNSLCVCDVRKANWYLDKNLAEKVSSEPFVVRLKFEPSRRPTLDEEFYLIEKDNRCVVCGTYDSFIRKNVVPVEYRRHFPKAMKDHKSHDVVLLCTRCHRRCSLSNFGLQRQLADICDAPLVQYGGKASENHEAKRIKSAAKALITFGNVIPLNRRRELEAIMCQYFGVSEITEEQLFQALDMETKLADCQIEPHALKVVRRMAETQGLLLLERMWREHFLVTMDPKFLPRLWSVDHGHATLRARTAEGTDEWVTLFGKQQIYAQL